MHPSPPPPPGKIQRALRLLLLAAFFMVAVGIGTYMSMTLIVKGEETVVVPDLQGMDLLESLERLGDLGLNTRVKATRYHDRISRNHIIDQEPAAGARVKRGRDIRIQVSRGPETVTIPPLVGLSHQQAAALLVEKGLCQGVLARMTSARQAPEQVIAQYPAAGATVARGTCTDLLISRGPPPLPFAMADLTGMPLEAAVNRLERLQLRVGEIRSAPANDVPPETVIDQWPVPGHRVTPAERVDLTVKGVDVTLEAVPHPADGVALVRFFLPPGFLKRRVEVRLVREAWTVALFNDFLSPGQEIWLLVPKRGNPTVEIYADEELLETRTMDGRRS